MTISMLLDVAAGAYDDRPAIGNRAEAMSFTALSESANRGAGLIVESGARRVAFLGVNGPAFPAVLFAAALAGRPITPLNYRLAEQQLVEQLDQLGQPYLVVDDDLAPPLRARGITLHTVSEWSDEVAAAAPVDLPPVDSDSTAVALFTSGTTSKPKLVVLRHDHLVSYVLQTVEFASAEPEEAMLVSVPPYHVAGVGTVLTNLYAGRRLTYLINFTPGGWLDTVRAEAITNAMVVPTMLTRVVEHLAGRPADVPGLRSLAYGGARIPAGTLVRALEAFPQTAFVNAYGLTETSSTIAVLGPEDHRQALASTDPSVQARLASAGRAVPGVEFQLRDAVGEPVTTPGERGELWVRGPQVSGHYEGVGSVLDEQGWFCTRDLAYLDADGYLFVVGRADDTIIRGGENIAPAEIEDVLRLHERIRDVAVLGVPDEEWGERILAVVVPHDGAALTPEAVRSFVRDRLRSSRTPDDVLLLDELPYSPTGKLLRNDLRVTASGRPG